MLIAFILILISIFCILFARGNEPIPWAGRLRRIHAGVLHKAEWIAPDEVVHQVTGDYLNATKWLRKAAQGQQVGLAPQFLTGRSLARFQTFVNYQNVPRRAYFTGVMTANHHVQVRHFSESGDACLVIDRQTARCVESRWTNDDEWTLDQNLEDGVLVYEMCYDSYVRRWKIASFVQELPVGWGHFAGGDRVRMMSQPPLSIGRDS